MKKLILSFALFTAFISNAQSISLSDTLSTGDMFQYYLVDSATPSQASTIGNAAGTTWDFSNIILVDDAGLYNTSVIDIATSSFATDFPAAVYHEDFNSGVQTFFENTTTNVITHGFVFSSGGSDYVIKYNTDVLDGLPFPIAFGDATNDVISGEATVPTFGTVAISGTATIEADGEGELKLPGNTYANTLRVKTVETLSGLTLLGNATITRTSYNYYHTATSNFPIFIYGDIVLTIPGMGAINLKMIWSKDANPNYLSNETLKSDAFTAKLYPNPSTEGVTLSLNKIGANIEILNTIGKIVYSNSATGLNNYIDLSTLSTGVYFVRVSAGNEVITKKLILK
ncbi:hypothetical protein DNU06_08835 [Putridiphycobacter roseus]|uniref:Secretion system C-terminal sorting domain-containing protein n=1 Tax=Putridiphycobacter roseus TaxID=2219161 RepID=A0A2W1NH93_9FLAO|nr:T9SS type A sorting domain-containing protein [Putridiphycobacter roseus]PZE17366.1 hypothetical protein DNU06_08835 [Putridiphycobacter roseus]